MAPFQTTPHRCQWTGSGVNGDFTTESPLSVSTARLSTAAQTTAAHNTVRINPGFNRAGALAFADRSIIRPRYAELARLGCDTAASDCGRRGFFGGGGGAAAAPRARGSCCPAASYAGFSHTVAAAVSRRPLGAAELAVAPPVALRTHRATAELQQRKSSTRYLALFSLLSSGSV
ncbi:uncharacterized protein P884DRAFT_204090 [Thermothelomyces heterothallicus CBS 202.75]|uniref:uncharacterized protein n=1 Tax=Thermothelomyces heterothallicus CBS 202.75 TaxID=1149848 RepID=UPI003743BC1D